MIYETVSQEAPIRQGDIFCAVPRVDFSCRDLLVVEPDESTIRSSWQRVLGSGPDATSIAAVVTLKSVQAIVVSQDCDNRRGEYLSLCEIDTINSAWGLSTPPATAQKWQRLIRKHSRENLRWFYLPEDATFQLPRRMAVDFRLMIRMLRIDLEDMRSRRVGRLNPVAYEHFRESLAQFFRRYPYNEWYPLTREEFEEYAADCPEPVNPYPWQTAASLASPPVQPSQEGH